MRIAVFDLGTNVFNLLIASVSSNKCEIEEVVKVNSHIGKGGFAGGVLEEGIIDSAIAVLKEMNARIESSGGVDMVKAFATSAIRDASNGEDFVRKAKSVAGLDIEVISGDREAELIYKGIRESILLYNEKVVMLDIGGGSNELVIADKNRIYWKRSFPLGVIRIKEVLQPQDPMSEDDLKRYHELLDESLAPFLDQIALYHPLLLIGSSGSFDTLRELIYPEDDGVLPSMELTIEGFSELHKRLLSSRLEERLQMAGMSRMRAEYMVLGSIFVDYIIKRAGIKELYHSAYSLKEGYMSEVAEQLRVVEIKKTFV
jgi:exopolyphosphatase / guanosine-5'-triphosphate,3'-diphosphate pyrophosphatase